MDRYQLVAKIGQGTFGVVSEFLDAARGYIPVAIKEVTSRDEFEHEVNILRELGTNQYVIALLNFFENAGKFYIVMPKADITLGRFLLRNRLEPDVIASIVMQIAYGLHGLHHIGWIHSDLKPENMVVTIRSGSLRVQLIDFGSCCRAPTTTTDDGTILKSDYPGEDAYVTTRWYRSPEVVMGLTNAVDKPIDVWALGCIALQMITGLVIFPAADGPELLGMFEAFFGPFDPEFIQRSPYVSSIFHAPPTATTTTATTKKRSKPQNTHLYTPWFERLERSLTIPVSWDDVSITTSRFQKTGIFAGDVPNDLFTKRVDLNVYVNSSTASSTTMDRGIIDVVQKMLAVDPRRRIDIDEVISSFF